MDSHIIACNLHDYIEIACLYGYQLRLTLKNGTVIEGTSVDIVTADKREYWIIDNGEQQRIDLTQVIKIDVLTPNAKFSVLTL